MRLSNTLFHKDIPKQVQYTQMGYRFRYHVGYYHKTNWSHVKFSNTYINYNQEIEANDVRLSNNNNDQHKRL